MIARMAGEPRGYMPKAKRDDWGTPKEVLDAAMKWIRPNRDRQALGVRVYDNWAWDLAASAENAVAPNFYTKQSDALSPRNVWSDIRGPMWCNPPYGRGIANWVQKAHQSMRQGADPIVMLLPARTDTLWFHQFIYDEPGVNVMFWQGRIKFVGAEWPAPFPSMLVSFGA